MIQFTSGCEYKCETAEHQDLIVQVTARWFQLLLFQLSLRPCHFIFFLMLQAYWKSVTFSPPLPDYKSQMTDIPQLVQQTELCLNYNFFIGTILSNFVENFFINSLSHCLICNWKSKLVSNLWHLQCPVWYFLFPSRLW